MEKADAGNWFKVVVHFGDSHRMRLRRTELEFYNELSERVELRENLLVNAVAIKADNGVLFAGNVSFFRSPETSEFLLDRRRPPRIVMSGPEQGWKTEIHGIGIDGEYRMISHTLTKTIVELKVDAELLCVRSCPID